MVLGYFSGNKKVSRHISFLVCWHLKSLPTFSMGLFLLLDSENYHLCQTLNKSEGKQESSNFVPEPELKIKDDVIKYFDVSW